MFDFSDWVDASGSFRSPDQTPHAGLSGGAVWKILHSGRFGALRRYPATFSRDRVLAIHNVLFHARSIGLKIVPKVWSTVAGATALVTPAGVWELLDWLPGQPLSWNTFDTASVLGGVDALADWSSNFATKTTIALTGNEFGSDVALDAFASGRATLAPGIERRRREWHRLKPILSLGLCDPLQPHIDLVRRTIRMARRWENRLETALTRAKPTPLALCLRDVHADHILFENRRVVGIIDFGAIALDSPAADFARWLGALAPLGHSIWPQALARFEERLPGAQISADLVEAYHIANLVLGALHWVEWLALAPRTFVNPDAAIRRWGWLLGCLEENER